MSRWPSDAFVLDMQTSEPAWDLRGSAGLLRLRRSGGARYAAASFEVVPAEAIEQLGLRLSTLSGPVVGFNLFAYDYPRIAGETFTRLLVARSVDVHYFLRRKNHGYFKGMSLDYLASTNLGRHKISRSLPVGVLERHHRHAEVAAYLRQNCTLIGELWQRLLRLEVVDVPAIASRHNSVRAVADDLAELLARPGCFTYEEWRQWYSVEEHRRTL